MFTNFGMNASRKLSAVSAVLVVALSGAVLEFGHIGALPQGTVEVGELVPLSVGGQPIGQLTSAEAGPAAGSRG